VGAVQRWTVVEMPEAAHSVDAQCVSCIAPPQCPDLLSPSKRMSNKAPPFARCLARYSGVVSGLLLLFEDHDAQGLHINLVGVLVASQQIADPSAQSQSDRMRVVV
jgi:hypothetical protein